MIRVSATLILAGSFLWACSLFAQEPPDELKPLEPLVPLEKLEKKESGQGKEIFPEEKLKKQNGDIGREPKTPLEMRKPEDPKEVMARIAKNMELTTGKLKEPDPGQDTRSLQQKILEDLDKLIQQSAQQEQKKRKKKSSSTSESECKECKEGEQPKSQKASSKKGEKKEQGSKSKPGQPKNGSKSKEGKGNQPQALAKQQPGGMKPQPQLASKKQSQQGGDPKQVANAKDKKAVPPAGQNPSAELFRDAWGHLPEKARMEMDAYSRGRFMPRYDQLLRQYYRTIAEQGRRREGE